MYVSFHLHGSLLQSATLCDSRSSQDNATHIVKVALGVPHTQCACGSRTMRCIFMIFANMSGRAYSWGAGFGLMAGNGLRFITVQSQLRPRAIAYDAFYGERIRHWHILREEPTIAFVMYVYIYVCIYMYI